MRLTILLSTAVFATSALAQDASGPAADAPRAPLLPTAESATEWHPPATGRALPAVLPTARARLGGAWGLGFLGTAPVLKAITSTSLAGEVIAYGNVPVVGARTWLRSGSVGVEFGLGVLASASQAPSGFGRSGEQGTVDLLGHLGLPIALASTPNAIVFLQPELRFGHSIYREDSSLMNASMLGVTARAGVEFFFGALGLPNLSLEAGARFGLIHEWRSSSAPSAQTRFETSLVANPWQAFTSSFAVRYYF